MNDWILYRACRGLCRLFVTFFYDYKAYGVHHVPRTGGVLMVSNHESYLDPVLVGVQVPRIMAYMAKVELFRNKYFGWFISQLNAFPVKQGRGDIGAVRDTIEKLKDGEILNIFPEGSRSEDGKLQPIQSGAALIVRRAQVPVVPCVLSGSFESWPKGAKFPRPAKLRVLYGPPMKLHDLKPAEITAIIDRTFHQMADQLQAIIDKEDEPWALRKLVT